MLLVRYSPIPSTFPCFLSSFPRLFPASDDNLHRVPHAKLLSVAAMPTKSSFPAFPLPFWECRGGVEKGGPFWRGRQTNPFSDLCQMSAVGFCLLYALSDLRKWQTLIVFPAFPRRFHKPLIFRAPLHPFFVCSSHLQLGRKNGQNKKREGQLIGQPSAWFLSLFHDFFNFFSI